MEYRALCFVLSVSVVVALVLPAPSDYAKEKSAILAGLQTSIRVTVTA